MYHQTKNLPLTGKHGDGKFAIVDADDFDLVSQHRWYMTKDGYVYRSQHVSGSGKSRVKKNIALHRILSEAQEGLVVDHIDRNPLNNSRKNLRVCTRSQNGANSPSRGGASRFKGVSWDKKAGKWLSGIKYQHKRYTIGVFDGEIDAAKAYNERASEFFGEFAHLNQV